MGGVKTSSEVLSSERFRVVRQGATLHIKYRNGLTALVLSFGFDFDPAPPQASMLADGSIMTVKRGTIGPISWGSVMVSSLW